MHLLITLLLVASMLHITASTVYHVMPDNHYHPINDNTYTLQHYLNNTNKYFTSNTQLLFLPGQYYLNNDLIIQGVSNFSLIGNRTNEVINTVINCTSPAGIVVVNSSNIVITNIVLNECGNNYIIYIKQSAYSTTGHLTTVYTLDCKYISYTYLHSLCHQSSSCGFQFVNVFKQTYLLNLISGFITIRNDNLTTNMDHMLHIINFQAYNVLDYSYTIKIKQYHTTSDFTATIAGINFINKWALLMVHIGCTGHNVISIIDCNFTSKDNNNTAASDDNYYYFDHDYNEYVSYIDKDDDDDNNINHYSKYYFFNASNKTITYNYNMYRFDGFSMVYGYYENCNGNVIKPNKIYISHCYIANITQKINLLYFVLKKDYNTEARDLLIFINSCMFVNNQHTIQIVSAECHNDNDQTHYISMFIKDIIITNLSLDQNVIYTNQVKLHLEGLIISNTSCRSIIIAQEGYLIFSNYNQFINNYVNYAAISAQVIFVQENSTLQFTLNTFKSPALSAHKQYKFTDIIKRCTIQYISNRGNLDEEFQAGRKLNYSILFTNNSMTALTNAKSSHCSWDLSSAFQTSRPINVNHRFLIFDNKFPKPSDKVVCICNNEQQSCQIEEIDFIYPGQNVSFCFGLNTNYTFPKTARISTKDDANLACKFDELTTFILTLKRNVKVNLITKHKSGKWCELCLKIQPLDSLLIDTGNYWIEIYTIILRPCPKGFSLHLEGYCQCDVILSSHIPSLTHCNIDDQSIPRPANSWISAHTVNNSHSYNVSLHCPFDYCLPHSSYLNLSIPDSQCQFDRSGLLCGQCQQGLSAVFGSSQCKHCSNVYLLLLIPIGIAGILLVLILFVLNLTVTDGNINPILLSVNIVSINISTVFPTNNSVMRTFISLANLDLGIETCFYDGMDEYAKRWLQLVFPAYLICIAMVIIITSRYSIRIQRLTARRALPVLATLFLLSYTKVLLTISNVLFSYSTITDLPNNHTTPVWSVETSVSLFGLKFTILFITCLLLFIVLIPFNVVLIFTRTLSYFRIVTYFKPLLDAYQGPYKIKFYYWTGLQLVVRAIFFGLSALDRDNNVMLIIILLGMIICLHKVFPFNKKINNVSEMLSLLNLQVIFVIAYFKNTNYVMINAAVSLVVFQLMCIILLHTKVLFCNDVNFTKIIVTRFGKWFPCFRKKESQRRPIELASTVPEVMYNYKEFQEPLIGQD